MHLNLELRMWYPEPHMFQKWSESYSLLPANRLVWALPLCCWGEPPGPASSLAELQSSQRAACCPGSLEHLHSTKHVTHLQRDWIKRLMAGNILFFSPFFIGNKSDKNQRWTGPTNKCLMYLLPLCHIVPLSCPKTIKNTPLLDWVTCSFITLNMETVVYFESVPHTPSFCC